MVLGTFERKGHAEQFFSEIETDMIRGDWFDPLACRVPLGEYVSNWIYERDLSVRTVELYRGLLRNTLSHGLGALDLADIVPPTIR